MWSSIEARLALLELLVRTRLKLRRSQERASIDARIASELEAMIS